MCCNYNKNHQLKLVVIVWLGSPPSQASEGKLGFVAISANPRQLKKSPHKVMIFSVARELGFEPRTNRLTAGCSTVELLPKVEVISLVFGYFINLF